MNYLCPIIAIIWWNFSNLMARIFAILCLTSRTTVTSARIPEEDACHRARNLSVFSHVQKGTPGLTHKGCALQHLFLDGFSDVTVVLGMRQYSEDSWIPLLKLMQEDIFIISKMIAIWIFQHFVVHMYVIIPLYRSYCSRRLRRIRKSLKFMCGNRNKFVHRKITEDVIKDIR